MTSTGAMSVSSGGGNRPRSHQGGGSRHQQATASTRTRHHRTPQHQRTDYHTEADTDRASSPRIGQRSQSLSALQPAAVIQPRMAQLETLEAKMASIEVSLSSASPRRKKNGILTSPSPQLTLTTARILSPQVPPHADQLEGLRNALRDKENIIRSLRNNASQTTPQNGLRALIQIPRDKELLTDVERRHFEDRLQRLKSDTDQKRLAIKNLKLALDKLDITDNIDVRIQQAELEYQLGREELNLLTLLEETRAIQGRLDESAAAAQAANKGRTKSNSVHCCVNELGGKALLLAVDTKWDVNCPRFGAAPKESGGLWVDWALEDTGLKKGDRLIEINGKLVVSRCATREDLLRLLSAAPDPAQLVVLRPSGASSEEDLRRPPSATGEVGALRSELGLVRERAEEATRAKDGLRADNLRLTHRISYLEEQVSELLETRRHRHHSSQNHQRTPQTHHQRPERETEQVRVVTTTAVTNNQQNVTNINIGAGDMQQVYQKGPQVTALVQGTPRHSAPAPRTPSNPCIAAGDKYTTDDDQRTDVEEIRPRTHRRTDLRSVKSLDLDSEPSYQGHHSPYTSHYAKPRKSIDYTSEPVATTVSSGHFTRKRPTPPKKPVRLSLHRAQSLQSVENGLSTLPSHLESTGNSRDSMYNSKDSMREGKEGRKRTHRGERSANLGLRWGQTGLQAVAVHLHQRQTARWC